MSKPTLIIDIRGLTDEEKFQVWSKYWDRKKTPDVKRFDHEKDQYFFLYNESHFSGNISRLHDTSGIDPEYDFVDRCKPVFEQVRTVVGLEPCPNEYIIVDGHKYKLVN